MPFSISIGDVFALCELSIKVGEAIAVGKKAKKEFIKIQREINDFQDLLKEITPLCDGFLSPEAQRALEPILQTIYEYNKAMEWFIKKNPSPDKVGQRIVWTLRAHAKIAELHEKLSSHRQSLSIRLNRFYAQQHQDNLSLCHNSIRDLRPNHVIITVVDAIGEHIPIPLFLGYTYEILMATLRIHYQHKQPTVPGRSYVMRGDFDLVHGENKQVINTVGWCSVLSSDLKVEMSMILRHRDMPQDKCPRCRTTFDGEAVNGWATCSNAFCKGYFQIKQHVQEVDEPVEIKTPSVASSSPQSERSEWALFRLLSIVSIIFTSPPVQAPDPPEPLDPPEPPESPLSIYIEKIERAFSNLQGHTSHPSSNNPEGSFYRLPSHSFTSPTASSQLNSLSSDPFSGQALSNLYQPSHTHQSQSHSFSRDYFWSSKFLPR